MLKCENEDPGLHHAREICQEMIIILSSIHQQAAAYYNTTEHDEWVDLMSVMSSNIT